MSSAQTASDHEWDMFGRRRVLHRLYTFVHDKKPFDTNGVGINAFCGSWVAVSPTGAKVAPRS